MNQTKRGRRHEIRQNVIGIKVIHQNNNFYTLYYINNNLEKCDVYKRWYITGEKECVCYYNNNQIHGNLNKWYKNGKLKRQQCYKNGVSDGTFKWYSKGGSVVFSFFVNGKQVSYLDKSRKVYIKLEKN